MSRNRGSGSPWKWGRLNCRRTFSNSDLHICSNFHHYRLKTVAPASTISLIFFSRVVRGRLRRPQLAAISVQPEVHVHGEGRDLSALQEPPGRGRLAARRGAEGRLHHPGAPPRKAGPLPQPRWTVPLRPPRLSVSPFNVLFSRRIKSETSLWWVMTHCEAFVWV